ncbi:hypothetical protein KOR34_35180 [Posidoniimonas corsicana]|uniref:Uncharacterized protein n=1 Tax=Posidoniimonas corsicana TaxID=1938618 RepID=A0A5C5V7F8_9BACT|nr:hypothetical protein [Posidoniimonas corsicana]TWT33685.1 hypothetical protein KOR34_35180 [Posidoniimonas corsicana]
MSGLNPYRSPSTGPNRPEGSGRRPSMGALAAILIASFVVAMLVTPADPFSMYLALALIAPLSLGAYFAGLR